MRTTRITSSLMALVAATSLTAACSRDGGYSPGFTAEQVGTVVGAGAGLGVGSMIGSGSGRVAALIGGTLLGGILGNQIGQQMDANDRAQYGAASSQVLSSGRPASWSNPSTGNYGTITPTRTYTNAMGEPCYDYVQNVNIDGRNYDGEGRACRSNSDGQWRAYDV